MANTSNTPSVLTSFYSLNRELVYHELQISIRTTAVVQFDTSWIGSVLRNSFLFAAEQVRIMGNLTLRKIINILPLNEGHPLYNRLKGGFPKGYNIVPLTHCTPATISPVAAGEELVFSLLLFGSFAEYYEYFIKALEKMCEMGIGKPHVPLCLSKVEEINFDDTSNLLYQSGKRTGNQLIYPVGLVDFVNHDHGDSSKELTVSYPVPVNLHNNLADGNSGQLYPHHDFPGFYQLVNMAAYRTIYLTALYAVPERRDLFELFHSGSKEFLENAHKAVLTMANIHKVEYYGAARGSDGYRIPFMGYKGELTFKGDCHNYISLLLFAQKMGVGAQSTYGLGRYQLIIRG